RDRAGSSVGECATRAAVARPGRRPEPMWNRASCSPYRRSRAEAITSEGIDARRPAVQNRTMTTTTLSRTHVSTGCLAEYEAFATLIEGLNEKEWNAATRCVGWQGARTA